MAHDKYFEYRGSDQARAFAAGVEYANDGALSVQGIFFVPGPRGRQTIGATIYVHVHDDDGDKSDSDPLPKRWAQRKKVDE